MITPAAPPQFKVLHPDGRHMLEAGPLLAALATLKREIERWEQELDSRGIEELGLPLRYQNALVRAGIGTVAAAEACKPRDLRQIRNFGVRGRAYLMAALNGEPPPVFEPVIIGSLKVHFSRKSTYNNEVLSLCGQMLAGTPASRKTSRHVTSRVTEVVSEVTCGSCLRHLGLVRT